MTAGDWFCRNLYIPPSHAQMEPYPTTATAATGKAPLGKRFLALLVDGLIAGAITAVFGFLGSRMGGIGALVGAGYMLVRDGLTLDFANGRSVGKQLLGLDVVRLDGRAMDIETSIRRNWTLVIGSVLSGVGGLIGGSLGALLGGLVGGGIGSVVSLIEGILVITDAQGRRIGDKTGGTEVIESEPV